MKKHSILSLVFILLTTKLYAEQNFDIYGIDADLKNKISSACLKDINNYLDVTQALNKASPADREKILFKKEKIETPLLKKINTFGNFSLTRFSTIYYPDEKMNYTTLDIVRANDTAHLPKRSRSVITRAVEESPGLKELFLLWNNYHEKNFELMFQNKLNSKSRYCPVVHCTLGFDKQELIDVLPKLKKGATKYKENLKEIIQYSNNDSEREKAIFILAHGENYLDLAKFLISYTDDPSSIVRNNSMRVLGAILAKYSVDGLDIHRIIKALDFPLVTDRNKAVYVLFNMVKNDKVSHKLVIETAGNTLINLLRLQQPNNHDFAYQILKILSHKNYGERDYQSWQKWLISEK